LFCLVSVLANLAGLPAILIFSLVATL